MSENENNESITEEVTTPEVADTEAVDPSENEAVESASAEPATTPDMGKVIAGIKKKFREKGRQEGLAQAQQLAAEAIGSEDAPQASVPETTPTDAVNYAPGADAVWVNKSNSIYAEGKAKYEDFEKKFSEAADKAKLNPTLLKLYQYAIGVGNVESVYDIMTNSEKRAKMLDNTGCWDKELFNFSKTTPGEVSKVAPAPLDELKTAPAKGERSRADERRYILKVNNAWRGS